MATLSAHLLYTGLTLVAGALVGFEVCGRLVLQRLVKFYLAQGFNQEAAQEKALDSLKPNWPSTWFS